MNKLSSPKSVSFAGKSTQFPNEYWFDDSCILDMDYFVRTLSGLKAKGVRPDLIGSFIIHYASKWLPDLSNNESPNKTLATFDQQSLKSLTASWTKKRFFVETIVGILPPEKDSMPCNFLLRLLRIANMVSVEPGYRTELEKRVSWQLDQASLNELMIPSFSHTCGTLLDVELIIRLVKRFVNLDDGLRSGAALLKVAKLVDCYLAEAAIDSNLGLSEFVSLAGALPRHARGTDDGLYRAIDTYLKAHPEVSKQERMSLCRLIDSRKLSQEASFHAAQNERLPVRAVIQVLLSEQTKLNYHTDWTGSLSGTRSPNQCLRLDSASRCISRREMVLDSQEMEIKKLENEVLRLQSQCIAMDGQIKKLLEKKKKKKKRGFFNWKKLLMPSFKIVNVGNNLEGGEGEGEFRFWRPRPTVDAKNKLVRGRTTTNWRRNSMS